MQMMGGQTMMHPGMIQQPLMFTQYQTITTTTVTTTTTTQTVATAYVQPAFNMQDYQNMGIQV